MMKYVLTILVTIFLQLSATAQYEFTFKAEQYQTLQNATQLSPDTSWNYLNEDVSFSFPISFFDETQQTLTLKESSVFLDNSMSPTAEILYSSEPLFIDGQYAVDLNYNKKQEAGSKVSYVVEGVEGNRIIKVAYENLTFENGNAADTINFQFWYYEIDKAIEYHYGNSTVTSTNFSATPLVFIGSTNFDTGDIFYQMLKGNPASPVLINETDGALIYNHYLDGLPASGTVYRFAPKTAAIIERNNSVVSLKTFPNPVSSKLNFISEEELLGSKFSIVTIEGKKIQTGLLNTNTIDVSGLVNGQYIITVEEDKNLYRSTFIKE